MENVVVLGSTGSIGRNTLDVLGRLKNHKLIGISFNRNLNEAVKQIERFKPRYVCCGKGIDIDQLHSQYPEITFFKGKEGLLQLCNIDEATLFVNALVGTAGLLPTYTVLSNTKKLALANKESLVIGGKLILDLCKRYSLEIVPLDSEHSAIYQCLEGKEKRLVKSVILTASGGPFIDRDDFADITVDEALKHPNWSMGKKVTIDSATMMNKGFEIIEARWLFDLDPRKIKVLIHRQSIIHSAVEFIDGSIMAQMAYPDMRIPIAYALTKPERIPLDLTIDLASIGTLSFEKPDTKKFPTIEFAYEALRKEETNAAAVLNAADEVAVEYFLEGKIAFKDIFRLLELALKKFVDHLPGNIFELEQQTVDIENQIRKLIEKDFIGG